eukprot:g7002.t1
MREDAWWAKVLIPQWDEYHKLVNAACALLTRYAPLFVTQMAADMGRDTPDRLSYLLKGANFRVTLRAMDAMAFAIAAEVIDAHISHINRQGSAPATWSALDAILDMDAGAPRHHGGANMLACSLSFLAEYSSLRAMEDAISQGNVRHCCRFLRHSLVADAALGNKAYFNMGASVLHRRELLAPVWRGIADRALFSLRHCGRNIPCGLFVEQVNGSMAMHTQCRGEQTDSHATKIALSLPGRAKRAAKMDSTVGTKRTATLHSVRGRAVPFVAHAMRRTAVRLRLGDAAVPLTFAPPPPPPPLEPAGLTLAQLKAALRRREIDTSACALKSDYVEALASALATPGVEPLVAAAGGPGEPDLAHCSSVPHPSACDIARFGIGIARQALAAKFFTGAGGRGRAVPVAGVAGGGDANQPVERERKLAAVVDASLLASKKRSQTYSIHEMEVLLEQCREALHGSTWPPGVTRWQASNATKKDLVAAVVWSRTATSVAVVHWVRQCCAGALDEQPAFEARFAGGSLGLGLVQREAGQAVQVEGVVGKGQASELGIVVGDSIISVGGTGCETAELEQVVETILGAPRPVLIGFRRASLAEGPCRHDTALLPLAQALAQPGEAVSVLDLQSAVLRLGKQGLVGRFGLPQGAAGALVGGVSAGSAQAPSTVACVVEAVHAQRVADLRASVALASESEQRGAAAPSAERRAAAIAAMRAAAGDNPGRLPEAFDFGVLANAQPRAAAGFPQRDPGGAGATRGHRRHRLARAGRERLQRMLKNPGVTGRTRSAGHGWRQRTRASL